MPNHRARIGYRVLTIWLVAIAIVIALALEYRQTIAVDNIRDDGITLARLVTKLPGTDEQKAVAWREFFEHQHRNDHFAYGVILTSAKTPLVEVAGAGVLVPQASLDLESGWVKEMRHDGEFIEFLGPISIAGERGFFRIGYATPPYWVELAQLPKIASLMLPVFLLVPAFLFIWRREVTPLQAVNEEMSAVLATDDAPVAEPDDVRSFVTQFNHFISQAKEQIAQYETATSELVTSEKFLSYRLHRFEGVLQALPDGIVVVDADASITFANKAASQILGVEDPALIGQKVSQCVQTPELEPYVAKGAHSIAQLVGESVEFTLPHHAETTFSATAYRLEMGESAHHIVYLRDASRETRARRSRSEFVAHLAHELKAPLNTLAMYSEALQDDAGVAEDIQLEAANVIGDEVERLARLINNLLSMTQIEMGTLTLDKQRVKLVDLVRDATETMQRSARGRDLEFVLDMPSDVIPVQVDKDLLRIAINNLLTNAIKYTDAGGTITVGVSEGDDAVTICVADTGIGIDPEDQLQIFDKFYRASGDNMENRSGHGLGLPLARDIVSLHHGSIRVESAPGQGSSFYIDLWKNTGVLQQAI